MRQQGPGPFWVDARDSAVQGEQERSGDHGAAVSILTNRIAAALAHHQPGWLLPRPSVLARRYNVTTRQIEAAIDELAARHLLRVRPDGRACRISPAEYMLELEGQHGLAAHVEPVHGTLACRSHSIAWHSVRADIARVLGIAPGEPACIVQMLWTVSGSPAAATTIYLAEPTAKPVVAAVENGELAAFRTILPMPPTRSAYSANSAEPDGLLLDMLIPSSLHIEMQQPPPWAAKALRLSASDSAIGISVSYTDAATNQPAALAVAVLRPGEFRVTVDSVVAPLPSSAQVRSVIPAQRRHAAG
jgi:DNA-binding GntR family transcriptional regulator